MYSIENIRQWFEEVVEITFERNLDPTNSLFALLFFTSLDFDLVDFFQKRHAQISSLSGESFHLITPMIYEGNLIADDELRDLRDKFKASGIPLPNRPSAILFKLRKRESGSGFEPDYIAAYEFPELADLATSFKDFIDICVSNRADPKRLKKKLTEHFRKPNIIKLGFDPVKTPLSELRIADVLRAPRVFLSYTHRDSEFVDELYSALKSKGFDLWLDRIEVLPGMDISSEVQKGLKESDALITVLSKYAADSNWLAFEGSLSYGAGTPVIPVVIDEEGRELAEKLPFTKGVHYVDLVNRTPEGTALDVLFRSLAKLRS